MNKRRIFIAINLPDNIKQKLTNWQQRWLDLPVRWTKRSALHLTLFFIGEVDDEQMLQTCQLTKKVVSKHNSFLINLEQICLGPLDKKPRMIWLLGQASQELAQLRNDLEQEFEQVPCLKKERKAFRPHITLARIKQGQWNQLTPKPELSQQLGLSFEVDSIEVMESRLLSSGAEYDPLESILLRK